MAYTRFDSGAVAHYIDDPDICADDSDSLPDLIADSGSPVRVKRASTARTTRAFSHQRQRRYSLRTQLLESTHRWDIYFSICSSLTGSQGTNHTVSALFNGTIGAAVFQPPPPSADDLVPVVDHGEHRVRIREAITVQTRNVLDTFSVVLHCAANNHNPLLPGARERIPSSLPDAVLTELGIPMPAISLLRDERMGISYEFREYGSTSEALATLQVIYDVIDHYWLLVCYALFTSILHGFNSTLNFGALIGMSVHDFMPRVRAHFQFDGFAPLTEYMADKQRANMIEFALVRILNPGCEHVLIDSLLEAAPIPASARDVLSPSVNAANTTNLDLMSTRKKDSRVASNAMGGEKRIDSLAQNAARALGFNTVVLLTFEDGSDVIARLNRSAFNDKAEFPEELLTDSFRSEVATLAYVRQQTSIPVPEVYYFDSDPRNPVGARYMLVERILGEDLFGFWCKASHQRREDIVTQLACMESELLRTRFPTIGGLTDANGNHLLVAHVSRELNFLKEAPEEWARERAKWSHVNGGFDDIPASYALQWLSLLSAAIVAMPSAAFKPADFALFHDDFTMGNMLVSDSGTVVGIIDWEGSRTLPLWNGSRHVGLLQDVNMFDDEVEMESLQRLRRNIIEEKTGQPYPVLSSLSLGTLLYLADHPHSVQFTRANMDRLFLTWFQAVATRGCEWELTPFFELKRFIEAILDVSTPSAGSEDSKMNAILDISAIPVSSSPSLLNREPTMLNAGMSCEWRWNPDTQEILDAGGTSWAENTPSPMKIIISHGEYDSELLGPPTMRKPGAAVSPLSPARTLSTYTVLPAPPPIELQYFEGDVDAALRTSGWHAKSGGSGTHSESESEFDADDSGEFVPGRSNSKRRRVKQELMGADGPLKRLRGRGRAKAANHRNIGSAADALRVITELSSVRTSSKRIFLFITGS
ncbi:hypothetical protein B0H14DRAFT_3443688 [Mycena olivaceomarginata]|nr:hypothetical protein B0H14DRAFT_3443688 [Mycena olivaceomarginata]